MDSTFAPKKVKITFLNILSYFPFLSSSPFEKGRIWTFLSLFRNDKKPWVRGCPFLSYLLILRIGECHFVCKSLGQYIAIWSYLSLKTSRLHEMLHLCHISRTMNFMLFRKKHSLKKKVSLWPHLPLLQENSP